MEELISNLKKRNFEVHSVSNRKEAKQLVLELLKDAKSVSFGGSVTLEQCGIIEALYQQPNLVVIDRKKAENSEEKHELMRQAFYADAYLTSANALLKDGRIVNIDGRGNRLAATIYGPRKVIYVIGKNKIVEGGLEDGIRRVKNIAAPLNAKRLGKRTPCAVTGRCTECSSPDRICHTIGIVEWAYPDKLHIVLVDEELGY